MTAVKEIKDSKLLWTLRNQVLWQHKQVSDCYLEADTQPGTFHVGAVDTNNAIIGTATFIKESNISFSNTVQYRLRAMAIHPSSRGLGLGKQMIEKAIEKLKQMKVEMLWCDARIRACGFYQKLNFKVSGKIYEVPEIGPHKLMYYQIK